LLSVGVGGVVVVRALGDRDPPEAHRARRIETRRLAERALSLVVIERVDEAQTLIEPALSLGRIGRDSARVAPERAVEHGAAAVGALRVRAVGRGLRGVLPRRRAASQKEK